MEAPDYSKASLQRFLETAERQGFFNANTLGGMKSAVAKLLEDTDAEDMRKVDVKVATIRYHNKHPGDLSPSSLGTYEQRLKRVIEEFGKYNQDPTGYKPFSKPVSKTTADRPARAGKARKEDDAVVEAEVISRNTGVLTFDSLARTTPTAMAMEYPIRDNFMAQVILPRGMTSEEARRLCAFIRTLAVDFSPET